MPGPATAAAIDFRARAAAERLLPSRNPWKTMYGRARPAKVKYNSYVAQLQAEDPAAYERMILAHRRTHGGASRQGRTEEAGSPEKNHKMYADGTGPNGARGAGEEGTGCEVEVSPPAGDRDGAT